MSEKYLIVGATGSIGSNLAEQLYNSGKEVHLIGRNENQTKSLSEKLNCTYTIADVLEDGFVNKIKSEIDKIKSGKFDKIDNPIKNAPHTDLELASDEWNHKYSREQAAYPAKFLKANKFWPPVARVDNVYGDKNIFCTCPSMDEFKEDAA